ncbi:phage major capsid protein [Methylobacterium sp. WL30]|uniref:phage major capsid protein n=1 Tax=unclassified Methylobacterium TaxID=2615210 RepID=UPI0011C9561E|nr:MULTISPECIES: phage major capsid protein [unclassified Methylobacterium]TXN40443.1 phage major capsid protein [Methylobacterium sp. WL93]TXN49152.1 phage major capsid protein [Methylobacterium sp. WL119]TXN68967.1 phage major capsid protein [Methylobacterium sp. WL30]
MNRALPPRFGAFHASFLACEIGGIRVAFDAHTEIGVAEFKAAAAALKDKLVEVKSFGDESRQRLAGFDSRLAEVEQMAARRGGAGGPAVLKSWGQRFVESEEYKSAEGSRDRQGRRYHAVVAATEIEHKNLTSVSGSGASLVPVDRRVDNPALLPWVQPSVRDLVAPGTTSSNAVSYPRMTGRTNNAASVAEGALKPQSDANFEEVVAPVRTIAHFFLATRQIMDDAPALAATIDAEARAGLADQEDAQLLFGDGTGQNLLGLVPQASAFVKQWATSNATPLDVLIQAIAQVEALNWKVDGMVLNAVDWRRLQSIRDSTGRYVGNSPFEAEIAQRIWNTPVVATNRMPMGKFLIGPFRTQAQIFDRLGVEVVASSEDSDNFRRNLITLRAEERLAFTCRRPASFVTGDLTASLAG